MSVDPFKLWEQPTVDQASEAIQRLAWIVQKWAEQKTTTTNEIAAFAEVLDMLARVHGTVRVDRLRMSRRPHDPPLAFDLRWYFFDEGLCPNPVYVNDP